MEPIEPAAVSADSRLLLLVAGVLLLYKHNLDSWRGNLYYLPVRLSSVILAVIRLAGNLIRIEKGRVWGCRRPDWFSESNYDNCLKAQGNAIRRNLLIRSEYETSDEVSARALFPTWHGQNYWQLIPLQTIDPLCHIYLLYIVLDRVYSKIGHFSTIDRQCCQQRFCWKWV